uniref:Uncharacterized protein n=1 Tax=Lepeophtheirus salmonis TaxID=72036 RepID=A0A0K2TIH0_LEPSM
MLMKILMLRIHLVSQKLVCLGE